MPRLIIYGGGQLGRQIYSLLATHSAHKSQVLGFADDMQDKGVEVIAGVRTLGGLGDIVDESGTRPEEAMLVMGIGYSNMVARGMAYSRAKELGYAFGGFVHPAAYVEPDVQLGEGCIVLAGAVLDQHVTAGPINHFDISTTIGEYSIIDANNYIAAGATLAGSVMVGRNNFIGLDVTVVDDISIGNNNYINAKSLVYKNIDDDRRVVEIHQSRTIKMPGR